VSPDASAKEIKAQFYKLSMQYHPDRNSGDEDAHAKFIQINEAYSVLSKPHSRRDYDRHSGATGPRHSTWRPQRRETLRPDDWILYRRPGGSGGAGSGGPKFDYAEHERQHYGDGVDGGGEHRQRMRVTAREYARRRYYEELREADRRTPRTFWTLVLVSLGLGLIYSSGMVHMIFMDDEELAENEAATAGAAGPDVAGGGGVTGRVALGEAAASAAADSRVEVTVAPGLTLSLLTGTQSRESGTTVWQAGRHLARYVAGGGVPARDLAGRLWVDLGTGCGVVGLAAAHCGARAVLTDTRAVLQLGLTHRNVAENPMPHGSGASVVVRALDWQDALDPSFECDLFAAPAADPAAVAQVPASTTTRRRGAAVVDVVTAADVTYNMTMVRPLAATVARIGARRVLLALERRDPAVVEAFMAEMRDMGYARRRVRLRRTAAAGDDEAGEDGAVDPNVELWAFTFGARA
ncbi:hypothetical protein HK405_011322, partial [Cladochytrium tenue]